LAGWLSLLGIATLASVEFSSSGLGLGRRCAVLLVVVDNALAISGTDLALSRCMMCRADMEKR
jgi:hypothetical protein